MSKPDYARYGRKQLWILTDAASLLADEEPVKPEEFLARYMPGQAGIAGDIYDDLKDSIDLGQLSFKETRDNRWATRRIAPSDCFAWARARGYAVPDELRRAVESQAAEIPTPTIEDTSAVTPRADGPTANTPWVQEAKRIGIELRRANKGIDLDALAEMVRVKLETAGVAGRGGRIPTAVTIRRHALQNLPPA